eukprot:TRINITY_DN4192_c0_g1_i4.p1 TRINITY_DN4192_c0_g1~~TRINITY_DN4192_c0_g1_i4.p1  ORF type:complete len:659 (-),score=81.11 TRINITY_DN4192_c0_g1_i4:78-2054(-)
MVSALSRLASICNWIARLGPPSPQGAVHFEIGDFPENQSDKHEEDFQLFSLQQSMWFLGLYVCALFAGLIAFVVQARIQVPGNVSTCYLSHYRAILSVAMQLGVSLPTLLLLRRWSGKNLQQLKTQVPATFFKRLRCVMLLPFMVSSVLCAIEELNVRLVTGGLLDPILQTFLNCSPGRVHPYDRIADWSSLMVQLAVFAYFVLTLLPIDTAAYIATPFSLSLLTLQCFSMNATMDQLEYQDEQRLRIFLEVALWTLPGLLILCFRATQERTAMLMFQVLNHQHRATIHEKVLRCTAEHQTELVKSRIANSPGNSRTQETVSELDKSGTYQTSCQSCPAMLTRPCPLQGCQENAGEQDCIPENSQVFVQNLMGSVPLHDVKGGDYVLCVDKFTKQLDYVAVDTIERKPPPSNDAHKAMCRITLEDSSSLIMTTDHPVSVLGGMLPAADLVPEKHALVALRLQELKVTNVEILSTEGVSGVVSVHFNKGHRYDMLVAPHGSMSPLLNSMPVGAADAFPYKKGAPVYPAAARVRRSNSAPPSLFAKGQIQAFEPPDTVSAPNQDNRESSEASIDDDDDDDIVFTMDASVRQQDVAMQAATSTIDHSCKGRGCRFHATSGCTIGADACKFCHHESHIPDYQAYRKARQRGRHRVQKLAVSF